jgi:hypothetical protein
MPQHDIDIKQGRRILVFYGKIDPGFETAFPFLTWNGHIFFKNVRGEGASCQLQATSCKQDKKLFQKVVFLQNKFKTMSFNQ